MKVTPDEVYEVTEPIYSAEWKGIPFDVGAALAAVSDIEQDDNGLRSVGDGGSSVGIFQDHHGYTSVDDSLLQQATDIHPLVADAMAYVRRIRTWFVTHPDLHYDSRDEVKWFDIIWNWGGPAALAWFKANGTSAAPYRTNDARGRMQREKYLATYNRLENRAAHPWITSARDMAQEAFNEAARAFGREVASTLPPMVEGAATALGVLIVLATIFLDRKRARR